MDKSTDSLCIESEYCIWNGVEDDLHIYPLQLVFWIYTLMLCILVYPSIFTSTSGDSCMLSETTYVSLVNFPSIQIILLSVSLVTDQGFMARLASECSVDAQF